MDTKVKETFMSNSFYASLIYEKQQHYTTQKQMISLVGIVCG